MWVCGELLPHKTAFSAEDENTIRKVFIDIAWNGRLADMVEFFSAEPSSPSYMEKLAEAYNVDAKTYRARHATFDQVLQHEKALQVRRVLQNDLERLAKEVWEEFPEECAACAGRSGSQQKPDPESAAVGPDPLGAACFVFCLYAYHAFRGKRSG